jgi:hypothetical protein
MPEVVSPPFGCLLPAALLLAADGKEGGDDEVVD